MTVPELNGFGSGGHPAELFGDSGDAADGIEEHFGIQLFEREAGVVLVIGSSSGFGRGALLVCF